MDFFKNTKKENNNIQNDESTKVKEEALKAIDECNDIKVLDELRIEYLSKKGKIQALMQEMRNLSAEEKPKFGQLVNDLKSAVSNSLDDKKKAIEEELLNARLKSEKVDITLDEYTPKIGNLLSKLADFYLLLLHYSLFTKIGADFWKVISNSE